jgi:hypothetical protein
VIRTCKEIEGGTRMMMPMLPAKLERCGMRGVDTKVAVEVGLPDQAMPGPFLPPAQSGRFVWGAYPALRVLFVHVI